VTDVAEGGDEIVGGARRLFDVLTVVQCELGSVVAHRDLDLHAQSRRFGQTPFEAGEPCAVFGRVVGQDGRAHDGPLLERGRNGPDRRSVDDHRQIDDRYGTQHGDHLAHEDDTADAVLLRKLGFLLVSLSHLALSTGHLVHS